MNPITIIGSGLAGYTLAREFRKLDQQTPLQIITADDGTYYSKPQLSSALTHGKTALALAGAPADRMAKQLNIKIIPQTQITTLDTIQQKIDGEGQSFSYSSLVLAQGAEVIKASLTGDAAKQVISVNNLEDYIHFRQIIQNKKRVAILGCGLVGCEFANDLLNGGYQTDIIALSTTPLDILLPPELGKVLQEAFAEKGVNWHLGCSIQSIDQEDGVLHLLLSNGESLQTDVVLSAIGLRPVLQLAKTSGITVNRGIVVDRYLRTNITQIHAIGDCAEVEGYVLFYVAPLVTCARALAYTLVGKPTAVSYPPMPVILKTPACPIVVNPPLNNISGEWKITGQGRDKKGLFFDRKGQLQGFALTGNRVAEKMVLVKELPLLF